MRPGPPLNPRPLHRTAQATRALLPRGRTAGGRLAAGILAGTGVGALVGAVGAHLISGPQRPKLPYGFTPYEVDVDARDVSFEAADGTRLAGWFLTHEGSDAAGADVREVVVVSHGHRGSRQDMLGAGRGLWREGFEVLLYDFRGNGDSADGPQSLAHYEQQDLEAAIDLVERLRPGAPIHLMGFSMGAATSILVAARDARVHRVVADSPFADMRGVIAAALRARHLPPLPALQLVDRATHLCYGYRFADVAPVEVVADIAPRPLLLVHGTEDSVIPVDHAHRLADAAGPGCEVEIVEGVDHCGAYFADRPGYVARVAAFLRD